MGAGWQLVAFPVILPWREDFWTLPLYFPGLKVGVTQDWPLQLNYQGMPLPPEAEAGLRELKHYHPGELQQWQAFRNYRLAQGEEEDFLEAIRAYGAWSPSGKPPSPDPWTVAWQLEKIQADQEAQLALVDRGQEWLKEILAPEPWETGATIRPLPGEEERVDPELARLRYLLWRRVVAAGTASPWAPLLLGRTSRALFLALNEGPQELGPKKTQISLPGCRSAKELAAIRGAAETPDWQEDFIGRLADLLAAVAFQDFEAAAQELREYVAGKVETKWPVPVAWKWELEIWGADPEAVEAGPVLSWLGAGAGPALA